MFCLANSKRPGGRCIAGLRLPELTWLRPVTEIGSLEVGKRADVTVIDLSGLHSSPRSDNAVSSLVYSCETEDVRTTIIDGRVVMRDGELSTLDESAVVADANRQATLLAKRTGM